MTQQHLHPLSKNYYLKVRPILRTPDCRQLKQIIIDSKWNEPPYHKVCQQLDGILTQVQMEMMDIPTAMFNIRDLLALALVLD